MHLLNKRPVTFFVFFLMAGILTANLSGMEIRDCILLAILLSVVAAVYLFITKKTLIPFLIIAFLLGNFLFINQMHTDFSQIKPHTEYTITGRVCDYPDKSNPNAQYTLADVNLAYEDENSDFNKRVLLRTPDRSFEYGDILTFKAIVYRPVGEIFPGSFNNKLYLASRSIGFSVYSKNVDKTGWKFMPYGIFLEARSMLARNIDLTHSPQTAPIAKAMFLGIKDELPDEITNSFASTGISHILAISGLHIGIIALLLNLLLKKTKIKRDFRFILNISLLVLYASVTGFPVSIIRAGIMMIFILVGRWKFFERDTLIFLSAAMLLILLVSPAQLFMPGFLLSFGTVFGILCLYHPLKRLFQNKKDISLNPAGEMFCVSVSASAASYPMTAYYFNNIALIAPLSNFVAVPSATVIVVFTGLSAFAAFFSVAVGKCFAVVSDSFIKFVVITNHIISRASWGSLPVYRFPVWAGITVFTTIFILSDYFMLQIKKKAILLALLCGAALLCAVPLDTGESVSVTFLDVGYGEAAHIKYQDDDILITNATESAVYGINSYSEKNGITYDRMVLTESGNSHYDGALQILKSGLIEGEFVFPKVNTDITEICRDLGIVMHQAEKYDTLVDNGTLKLQVVGNKYNALSLLASCRENPICLFSGHSAKRSQEIEISAPVLRVASEGNDTSVNMDFLKTVKPIYAVISVNDSPYGLPDPKTTALLEEAGAKMYRTDQNYSVIMTVDSNNTITMRPMNED